jgi:hypothetical protein
MSDALDAASLLAKLESNACSLLCFYLGNGTDLEWLVVQRHNVGPYDTEIGRGFSAIEALRSAFSED